jgi:hypothetical protein
MPQAHSIAVSTQAPTLSHCRFYLRNGRYVGSFILLRSLVIRFPGYIVKPISLGADIVGVSWFVKFNHTPFSIYRSPQRNEMDWWSWHNRRGSHHRLGCVFEFIAVGFSLILTSQATSTGESRTNTPLLMVLRPRTIASTLRRRSIHVASPCMCE